MKFRTDLNDDSLPTRDDLASARDLPTLQTTEAQMRRALGLGDAAGQRIEPQERTPLAARQAERFSPDRHKRRFVRDGEVPVVVVRRDSGNDQGANRAAAGVLPTNRVELAEAGLRAEREARERAERALSEAQAVIRDLQTKLGHTGLARDEALDAARRAEADRPAVEHALQMAEAALQVERRARETAEAALEDALSDREMAEHRLREAVRSGPAVKQTIRKAAAPKPPRAAPASPSREPQPVKWWIKRTTPSKKR